MALHRLEIPKWGFSLLFSLLKGLGWGKGAALLFWSGGSPTLAVKGRMHKSTY